MARYLILGGYGGIGEKLCERLTASSHQVLIAGRDGSKAEACAARFGQFGFAMDAREEGSYRTLLSEILERHGPLDGVANLVGSVVLKPVESASLDDVRQAMSTNLETAFFTVKYLAPHLVKREQGGSIVLMSSVAARFGLPNHEVIAAAKGAVQGLMLSAAASYAAKGVRINTVAPALVETPLTQKIVSSDEGRKASAAMHPVGRIGQAEDVASMVAWLLDAQNSWVTGQTFGVDGGMASLKSRR